MSKGKIDWEQLRTEYAQGATLRDLGRKYGIDYSGIGKRAKKEGWKQDRQEIVHETATKVSRARARTHAEIGETRADVLHKTEQAALHLADVLEKTCAYLDKQPPEELIGAMKGLASLSQAMKNNGEQLMVLYGIIEPYRRRQVEIAQEKLDMEKAEKARENTHEERVIRIEDMEEVALDGNGDVQAEQKAAGSVPAGAAE